MNDPRYPIGKHMPPAEYTPAVRAALIDRLETAPASLRAAVAGLSAAQLDTPYREGGWTVRQVVHHLADSHMNAFIRARLAVTEQEPVVKPYDEKAWALLADNREMEIEPSVAIVEMVHKRFVHFLRSLPDEAFVRNFRHPERGLMTVNSLLSLYSWHGSHHVAHITSLRERMGW